MNAQAVRAGLFGNGYERSAEGVTTGVIDDVLQRWRRKRGEPDSNAGCVLKVAEKVSYGGIAVEPVKQRHSMGVQVPGCHNITSVVFWPVITKSAGFLEFFILRQNFGAQRAFLKGFTPVLIGLLRKEFLQFRFSDCLFVSQTGLVFIFDEGLRFEI